MKKNYTLFAIFIAFALQLTTAKAQDQKLTFSELTDKPYEVGLEDALKYPNQVYKLHLILDGNKELPSDLQKLPNLQMLSLSGNIQKLDWEKAALSFKKLNKLEYIYFQDETLSALPPQLFTLTQLKGLGVIKSNLTTIPAEISKLTNLEYLLIISSRLNSIPAQIGGLKNLKTLILDENNIKEIPEQMAKLKKIEELSFVGNPINDIELSKVRAYYPTAKILDANSENVPTANSSAE